jgi:hypothetical protein
MTWQLMKRDPAWQWMPLMTLAVASSCVMWHFLALADRAGIAAHAFEIVFLVLMVAVPPAVIMQQAETRFWSTLPVTVRQVFLARMISMVSLLWLPVVAGFAVLAAVRDPGVSGLPLQHWLALTCAILMAQCGGIQGYRFSRHVLALWAFVWMFGYGMRWELAEFSAAGPFVVAACCIIAGAIVLRTLQTVPLSFQESPVHVSSGATTAGGIERKRCSPASLWKPMVQTLFRAPAFVLIPFVLVLLQGTGPILYGILAIRWIAFRTQLRWLFALPVSPGALLAMVTLPTFFAVSGGYLLSNYLPPFPNGHERRISVRARQDMWGLSRVVDSTNCKTMNVLPSLDFWVPVKSGKAPLLQAPWGETFQPSTYRVSGYDIYNPYAVGCNNSERFLDWQFSRATIAAFGRPLDRDKSDSWYIVDWHAFITGPRTVFVNIAVIVGFLILSTLITFIADWHRFRRLPAWKRIAFVIPVCAVVAGLLYLSLVGNLDIVQWVYWTLPDSPAGAVAVTIAFLAPLCVALAKIFRQLEFVDKPVTPAT